MPTSAATPLPDLTGRSAIVTGGGSGIGAATARALAARGARVVLAVRNREKGERAARTMPGQVEVRDLDLADLASIRSFAAGWDGPIDLLVNNAGVSVPDLRRTADGFELQFGTNHLGPFALTNLLLRHVSGRVVALSSQAERMGRIDLDDLGLERTKYVESRVYAASKLANLLFVTELQRRLTAAGSPVLAAAAHPGLVTTNMTTGSGGAVTRLLVRLLAQDPDQGALPVLLAATGDVPPAAFTGPERFAHMRGGAMLIGRSRQSKDPVLASRLWSVSEELTGIGFGL